MKEVINILPIGHYLRTSYHLRELTHALDHLQSAYFRKKQPFLETLSKEVSFPLNELLKALAVENQVNFDNTAEVDLFLNRLRDDVQVIPHMTLTLQSEPTTELIQAINEWIILNLRKAIILDFEVNPRIIGGAIIAYQGKIVDHTLKKKLDGMMQTSKEHGAESKEQSNPMPSALSPMQ